MKSNVIKRSIDLGGHKTSVSLEDEFWNGLRTIAERQHLTVSKLAQRIDSDRKNRNLSSAIRVHVFNYFQAQANPAGVEASVSEHSEQPHHNSGISLPA